MTIRISNKSFLVTCFAVVLTFFATSGSLFYLVLNYFRLAMVLLFLVLLALPFVAQKQFRNMPPVVFLLGGMMFFAIWRNPMLAYIRNSYTVVMWLAALAMVYLLRFYPIRWISSSLNMMKNIYLIYAAYTIAMYFIPQMFQFTLKVFPRSSYVLNREYSKGCMPGLTSHYSTNGMLLSVLLMIAAAGVITGRRKSDKIYFGVALIAILMTGKRSDIIFGLVAVFFAYFVLSSGGSNKRMLQAVGVLIAFLLGMYILMHFVPALSVVVTRFEDTMSKGDVTLGRTQMWMIAIREFLNHMLLGIGWYHFRNINFAPWHAHNIFLQILCEAGIIGAALFFAFFIRCLWKAVKMLKSEGEAAHIDKFVLFALVFSVSMQTHFLLYGVTGNPLYDKEMYFPYFMACAIPECIEFRRKMAKKKKQRRHKFGMTSIMS